MPNVKHSPKPRELFEENREAFNQAVADGKTADFSNQNLSDLDLIGFNLRNANLSGAYMKGANLSGVDLSEACLHGASIKSARISGCMFPMDLSAEEIRLSVEKGSRIRHPRKQ